VQGASQQRLAAAFCSGYGSPLIECAGVEEIKGRRQSPCRWLVEVIGAVHDVGAEALGELARHISVARRGRH